MKLFTACLGTETNSFSPIPTGLDLFRRTMLVRGGAHGDKPNLFAVPLLVFRRRAAALGWQVAEGLAAFATPAGTTTRAAYETLRDEILADLEAALPVDGILLNLHGAMVADGYPDAEGDLLQRIRARVGPAVPIGVELDLHAHLTEAKVGAADIIVIYKEYPHVDVAERADELFSLMADTLTGRIRPVMAMHDCRMLGIYPTTREPVRSFVDRMSALEGQDGILSVSLAHGFPWSDTPEVGSRVVVVADGDRDAAAGLARRLGEEFWDLRDAALPPYLGIDAAIDRALAGPAGKPYVLADVADNPGVGAAGDSTPLLARLLERGIADAALSPLWDPGAVEVAFDAGVGARLPMRLGGKLGPASGPALDVKATVTALRRDVYQPFGGAQAALGDCAALRIDGVDVVVNSHRVQTFDPVCFSALGIDPARRRILVVKSTQHFHAGFAPIAAEILYVDVPGSAPPDYRSLEYQLLRRPVWPLVADPHAAE